MAWVLGDSSTEALAAANCPGRAAPGSMPGSIAAEPCTDSKECLLASASADSCSAQGCGSQDQRFASRLCKSRSERARHSDSRAACGCSARFLQ